MINSQVTVSLEGLETIVNFDYEPSEPMTFDYPGCPASIELCEVFVRNPKGELVDVSVLLDVESFYEKIEELVWEVK